MRLIAHGFYVVDGYNMHQDVPSIKLDVNLFPLRDWTQKTYCFLTNNELTLLFTAHKMQKSVHLFYWNMNWLLSS